MRRKATRNHGAPARRPASATPVSSSGPAAVDPPFDPVARRARHDGWTPARQVAFIEALAECGCVEEACGRVGMAKTSAYLLRRREDAHSFRRAWDMALDHAVTCIADAAFGRAIKGVEQPIFYRGEQVGVRVVHNERLAMFLMRYRDPTRYGAWLDACDAKRPTDGAARDLAEAVRRVEEDATRLEGGDDRVLDWTPPFPIVVARHDPKAVTSGGVPYRRRSQEEIDAALIKLCRGLAKEERMKGGPDHVPPTASDLFPDMADTS